MSDPQTADLLARIEKLEEQVAHQDQAIEDLNNTITGQWKVLDRYKREIERLNSELSDLADSGPKAPEPPPPHY